MIRPISEKEGYFTSIDVKPRKGLYHYKIDQSTKGISIRKINNLPFSAENYDITSMVFLKQKQILCFHNKNDEVFAVELRKGEACSKVFETAIMNQDFSTPEHGILKVSTDEKDFGVIISRNEIMVLKDFGSKSYPNFGNYFTTETSVKMMEGYIVAQFRLISNMRVVSLCENFTIFLHSYKGNSSSFLGFCKFGDSFAPGRLLTHVFEISSDERFIAVSSHDNGLGSRDKLFLITLDKDRINLEDSLGFPSSQKTQGSLIFDVSLSFNCSNSPCITAFELGNSRKVEMYQIENQRICFKKATEGCFGGLCLTTAEISGSLWSIDIGGNIYQREFPDIYIRSLKESRTEVFSKKFSMPPSTRYSTPFNQENKPRVIKYAQSQFIEKELESSALIFGRKVVEKSELKYYMNNNQKSYTNNQSKGNHLTYNKPYQRLNRNQYPKRGASNIKRSYSKLNFKETAQLPQYSRSRTPVKRTIIKHARENLYNRGISKSPMYKENSSPITPVIKKNNFEEIFFRNPKSPKPEPKPLVDLFNLQNVEIKQESHRKNYLGRKRRNQPKSYMMVRNTGRGLNLFKEEDSQQILDNKAPWEKERNEVCVTNTSINMAKMRNNSPFLLKQRKGDSDNVNKSVLNPSKMPNPNKTVMYSSKEKSYLKKNSKKIKLNLFDPILAEEDTLDLQNPNIVKLDASYKAWKEQPSRTIAKKQRSPSVLKGDTTLLDLKKELSSPNMTMIKHNASHSMILKDLDLTTDVFNMKNINYYDEEDEPKAFSFESSGKNEAEKDPSMAIIQEEKSIVSAIDVSKHIDLTQNTDPKEQTKSEIKSIIKEEEDIQKSIDANKVSNNLLNVSRISNNLLNVSRLSRKSANVSRVQEKSMNVSRMSRKSANVSRVQEKSINVSRMSRNSANVSRVQEKSLLNVTKKSEKCDPNRSVIVIKEKEEEVVSFKNSMISQRSSKKESFSQEISKVFQKAERIETKFELCKSKES